MYDAIIVGGGPAGLSAALLLGRCRRRVLVCDGGRPRNARSHALHGLITRDGIEPAELLRLGREQLRKYPTVELRDVEVMDAARVEQFFEITLRDGTRHACRKLLFATGVDDEVPQVEGLDALYGRSVFHCPYCDGFEFSDQPVAVYGKGTHGQGLALGLTAWTRDLVLCTDGPSELAEADLRRLSQNGIEVRAEPIARLEGTDGMLARIVFQSGVSIARSAMFFSTGEHQRSTLPAKLGCVVEAKGDVWTGSYEVTTVPGVYVAGDASRHVQLVVVAAAEGAEAAFAINSALLKEDLL